jgi:hypothetical protein
MKSARALLRIEELEDRTCPAPVDIGTQTGAVTFQVAGYNLFQNGAVTFATSSSAFGFSEASMTAPQSVTTANGGMVQSKLTNAYDGVLSWGIPTAGGAPMATTYTPPTGVVDIVGAPVSGTPNNIKITGPGGIITGAPSTTPHLGSFNGLQLAQQNAVFQLDSTTPVIRSIVFVTNPTNAPITQEIGSFNNLGSDNNTFIFSTSSGAATFTPGTDTWIGSFKNFTGGSTISSEPRLLNVIQGPGNVANPADAHSTFVNGNDLPTFDYNLTIAPGQTKALMIFNVLAGSRAKLTNIGHQVFDHNKTVRGAGLLAGLSSQEINEISNWNFDTVDPVVANVVAPNVTNASPQNAYDFTVTYTDDTAIDVSTLGNSNILVTGPNGFAEFATFVSVDMNSNGTPRTATYSITPPGGTWSLADNGVYAIVMQANQVMDLDGNSVAAGNIGAFQVSLTAPIYATGAGPGAPPLVNVYDANTNALKFTLLAFNPSFTGGVRVAVGDVNGDGTPDIVVGAGPGGGPQVRVFDGTTGQPLAGTLGSFYGINPSSFTGGVFVAVGDVNGDGFGDIIVGADAGAGLRYRSSAARTARCWCLPSMRCRVPSRAASVWRRATSTATAPPTSSSVPGRAPCRRSRSLAAPTWQSCKVSSLFRRPSTAALMSPPAM